MTAKKNNQYARIQTAQELDEAIKRAHAASKKLGRSVEHDFHNLRQNLKPSALVSNAVQQVTPYFAWSEIGLGLVRGLKKLIAPKKEIPGQARNDVRSAVVQSSQPAEESPSASES
jgi:hypothetical protein